MLVIILVITDIKSQNNDINKTVPMEVEYDPKTNNDAIDFTVDISLDQLDSQKEMTDEDVMHHLDVIENIELDPETFGMNRPMEKVNLSMFSMKEEEEEEQKQNEEVTVIDDEDPIEEKWYEKKVISYTIYFTLFN